MSSRAATVVGSGISEPAPFGPWPAPQQDEPNWHLTPDGVPSYDGRPACTIADANTIAFEFSSDGADIATQQWAAYLASREGGCSFDVVTVNPATRDDSHCAFQLNALSGVFTTTGELGRRGWTPQAVRQSMTACADAASDLWAVCGRGPWTPPYSCVRPL